MKDQSHKQELMEVEQTNWLFFPGGPGLNSEAERRFWAPSLRAAGLQVEFWDEPLNPTPPTQAYEISLNSAEEKFLDLVHSNAGAPVGLIGHFFGANFALELATRFPSLVSRLVLLAPGTQIYTAFLRIMRIGHEEAMRSGNAEAARKIEESLIATQAFPDQPMLAGLETALAQPGTPMRFWHSLAGFQKWSQIFEAPEWVQDPSRRMNILLSSATALSSRSSTRLNVPVWLGFGAEDEMISRADEVRFISQRFPVVEQKTFESAGHFLHLEAPSAVAQWLLELQELDPAVAAVQTNHFGEQIRRNSTI